MTMVMTASKGEDGLLDTRLLESDYRAADARKRPARDSLIRMQRSRGSDARALPRRARAN